MIFYHQRKARILNEAEPKTALRIGDGRTDGHDRTVSECFPCRWPEIKKDAALKPAKCSGIYSTDIDIGPPTNKMRHQNMHFAEIPPYLKNLTTSEMALISRITVVMNVHLL